MIRCKKCGTELPENAKFCGICGTPIEDAGQTESTGAAENGNKAEAAGPQAFGAGVQGNDAPAFGAGAQGNGAQNAGAQGNDAPTFGAGAQMNGNQQFANGAQMNQGQQFTNGAQMNQGQQFANGAQMNGNQQFTNGAQMNQGQQFTNGAQFQQAAPQETAAAYYGKQPYMPPADDAQANKGVAICGYFGLLWIVPLVTTAKYSPFAKFHANQSLMVFLTSVAVQFVTWILRIILRWIFPYTWAIYRLSGLLTFAGSVFGLVLGIVGIVYAAQGKMKEIPIIGQFHIIK